MSLHSLFIRMYYWSQRVPVMEQWREAEARQWWDRDRYDAYVQSRLAEALRHASENIPFYRDLGCTDGLDSYPVLTKQHIRDESARLQYKEKHGDWEYRSRSCGTLGQVEVVQDSLERTMRVATTWRGDSFGGFEPWTRTAIIWGARPVGDTRGNRQGQIARNVFNRFTFDGFNLAADDVRRHYQAIRRLRPRRLVGYVSSLRNFVQIARELGLEPFRVEKLITSSEQLDAQTAEELREFFGVPVTERYGCVEVGDIAHQCEHGNWHLHTDFVYPEVRRPDGTISCEGTGSLLLTKLHNRRMPLIRYELGDMATLGGDPCPCGRVLPVMRALEGRELSHLVLPDGSRISAQAISRMLNRMPVRRYQIVQESNTECRWLIVPDSGFNPGAVEQAAEWFNKLVEGQLAVEIQLVDDIPLARSGKHLLVVNKLIEQQRRLEPPPRGG